MDKHCYKCRTVKSIDEFYRDRTSSDGRQWRCKDCCKSMARAWDKEHREHVNARNRDYRKANPERARQYESRKYKKFKAQRDGSSKKWKLEHPEYRRERWRSDNFARYARIKNAPGKHSVSERKELRSSYLGLCVYCSNRAVTYDHVVAIARGGSNDIDNLAPSCMKCNSKKNSRSLLQFIARGGLRKAA